jgi:hypothetical protein
LGRDFRPVDDARLEAEVVAPGGARTRLVLEAAPSQPGGYEAVYRPQGPGVHRVHLRATAADGRPLGEAATGRVMDLDADEHRSIQPNLAALETLARQTGGQVTSLEGLLPLVQRLRAAPAPISQLEHRPLWDSWLVWLAVLACFAGEWALRRRRGLA